MIEEGMKIVDKNDDDLNLNVLRFDSTLIKFDDDLVKNNFKEVNKEDYFFLIDNNVFELFNNNLKEIIEKRNYFIVEGGDKNKNISKLMEIIDKLYAKNVSRSGTIVSIGGGVVTDMAGF